MVIEDKERTCDSLLMCIVTVLSHGLRSGGGVGDVLRKPSKEVQSFLLWEGSGSELNTTACPTDDEASLSGIGGNCARFLS